MTNLSKSCIIIFMDKAAENIAIPSLFKGCESPQATHVQAFDETVASVFGHVNAEETYRTDPADRTDDKTPEERFLQIKVAASEKICLDYYLTPDTADIGHFFDGLVEKVSERSEVDRFAKEMTIEAAANTIIDMYDMSLDEKDGSDEQRIVRAICAGVYVMFHVSEIATDYIELFDGYFKKSFPEEALNGFKRELKAFEGSEGLTDKTS